MRALIALAVAAATLLAIPDTRPEAIAGGWSIDAAISGTYNHFGNPPFGGPTFLCGVGYNLIYRGSETLKSVDVSVLYPDAFLSHVTSNSLEFVTGWQRSRVRRVQRPTPAELARTGDAFGAVCRNGPSDLDSLRGTLLRVAWDTASGSYRDEFRIEEIRPNMTICGDMRGNTHIMWADPRSC